MNNDIERRSIYLIKAYAIITVICAHTSITPKGVSPYIGLILSNIGTIGVVIFFVLSGYLFFDNQDKFLKFLVKKKQIIIPWIFCGVLVYIVTQFGGSQSEELSIKNMFLYLVGWYSSLYYLSILLVSYLVFFKLKKSNIILIVSISHYYNVILIMKQQALIQ